MGSLAEHPEFYNYVPMNQNIFELFFANGASILGWMVANTSKRYKRSRKLVVPPEDVRLDWVEKTLLVVITFAWVMQFYYKGALGWKYLVNLVFPCHLHSLVYIYLLTTSDRARAIRIFQWSWAFAFQPLLALLVPDFTDVRFFIQPQMYFIQHIALVFAPLYLKFTGRWDDPTRPRGYYWITAICISYVMHYDVQGVLGYLTGVNVNYMVWPPPGPHPFHGRYYRWPIAMSLHFGNWAMLYPVQDIVMYVREAFRADAEKVAAIKGEKME